MKKILTAFAVVIGIGFVLFIGLAGYFYFIVFGNADRTLAKNLAVTTEWTEIRIDPPLSPTYNHQAIYVRPIDYVFDRGSKTFEIRLPDGRVVKPEIEVYDDSGGVFKMHKSGFALGHQGADYADFSPTNKLSAAKTYTRFRIRSDVAFICEQIKWIDYDPK